MRARIQLSKIALEAKARPLAEVNACWRALIQAASELDIRPIFPSHPRYQEVKQRAEKILSYPEEGGMTQDWIMAIKELGDQGYYAE